MSRLKSALAFALSSLLVAAPMSLLIPGAAQAAPPASGPGSLDTSFASGGVFQSGNGFTEAMDSTVVQSDGKIVAGFLGNGTGVYVYRLTSGGAVDATWNGGTAYFWAAGTVADSPKAALAQDSSGRTYVTSAVDPSGTHPLVAVLRLTTAGAPDATWGTGGVVTADLGGNPGDHGTSVAVDPTTGRVYVTAWMGPNGNTDFGVIAFTSSGVPDAAFGPSGLRTQDFHLGDDTVRDVTVLPGGDIVLVGYVKDLGQDNTGLLRLGPDGHPVGTFGNAGTVEVDFGAHIEGASSNDGARSVVADASGNLFVSLRNEVFVALGARGGVAKFTATGALDTAFGSRDASASNGSALTFSETTGDNAGITLDAYGRPVVVGSAGGPTVARLVDARYPLDTTFNSSGLETLTCPGSPGSASAAAVQPDGQIVVVGACPEAVSPFNASVPTVWRLDGGDQVPLPATPDGGGDGVSTAKLTASNISVNGTGRTTTVAPGGTVALQTDWAFAPVSGSAACPACIDQVVAGFINRGPQLCSDALQPEVTGGSGKLAGTLTAPAKPGRYYLGVRKVQFYGCTTGAGLTWDAAGRPWGGDVAPSPVGYLAEVNVVAGVSGVSLKDDTDGPVPAGHHVTPVAAIPLDALTATLEDLQAAPLRGSPLRGSPLRGSPLRGSPLRGSPLRGSPLRGSPLRGSPLRGSPIPLSQLPLDPPNTWAAVLVGTIYANQPTQNVTLQQVLALEPAPAAVAALSLADIDISRTPLRNVSLVAFLLGNTPASALGLVLPTGADATQSLVGLELAGLDLSATYARGVHIKGKALVDAPISGVRLGDMWLAQTPLGAVQLSSLPSTWYRCAGNPCQTLADAQTLDVDNGITSAATIGALLALSSAPDPTVGQLLPGLLPRDQLGYERLSTATIANASPLPAHGVRYTASFTVYCATQGTLTAHLDLPVGFRAIPATAAMSVTNTPALTVSLPPTTSGVSLGAPLTGCSGLQTGTASIEAEPGVTLGPTTTSVAVSFNGTVAGATDSAVTVGDNQGDTPVPVIGGPQESTLFLGHISAVGDQDAYTLSALDPGTQVTVKLSHITTGHDDDLSVFGPGTPALRTSPLRGSPLRGSPLRGSAVEDSSLDPSSNAGTASTEPQADVPVQPPAGSTVLGVSANRGATDESVMYTVPDGVTAGGLRIVVSGYNGSVDTTTPYTLLVSITPPIAPPVCAPPNLPFAGQGTAGAAVTSIPIDTQTIILTNQKRLGDLYGPSAAATVMSKLGTLALRTDVRGVVVPVESDPAVATAYAAWDAAPCSAAKANDVVAKINAYVDRIRLSGTGLRYIVIAGGDLVVPMARVQDRMALDNEASFANDQVYNNRENALSGSLRGGYVLSDDPYGDFNPIPWLDGQAFVPDVAIGRLVETPADIAKAVDQYVGSNGVRAPTSAYTAGYDFNADGAQAVADALAPRVPTGAASTSINDTWTRLDAITGMSAAAHGFSSVNGHYDAYRALPANENSGGTQNQLLTTSDLPSSLGGGILFTIGCHAGLNVADTFVASPTESVRQKDWAQSVSSRGGVLAGNTGYGYGDSTAVAYSEKLMADFAKNLDGSMTVGQALMFAKHSNVHLPLAVVDVKVMEEATFYGLPMYRLGAAGQVAGSVVPTTSATGTGATATGSPLSSAFPTSGTGRHLVRRDTARGTYYVVQDGTATPAAPLAIPGRPLEPQVGDVLTPRSDGLRARGVVLDALSTHLTSATGGYDPVYSAATPDSSTLTPEPATVGSFFPAGLAGVVERATPAGVRDVVVLTPGQFRAASGTSALGWQQLSDSIGYHVLYSDSDDVRAPAVSTVRGVIAADTATFTVTTGDTDVASASVLYLVRSSTSAQAWVRVDLASSDGGHTFTGSHALPAGTTVVEQYVVQLVDTANNVSLSSKKGQDFSAAPSPAQGAPSIAISGTQTGGSYVGPQVVTVTGTGPISYVLDANPSTPYTGPFTVSAPGAHQVVATSGDASTTTYFTIAATPPPVVTIASPSATVVYTAGTPIDPVFSCVGYQVTSCQSTPAVPDTTLGTHTFTVNAADAAGHTGSASVTYTVKRNAFNGFLQPIDDPAGSSPSIFAAGSTIPVKFQLVDVNGVPIADATAAALAARCDVTLTWTKVGLTNAPVDESVTTASADTGQCFRYESSSHQFVFNLGTKSGFKAGWLYDLRAHFASAWTPDHVVRIGLR